MKKRHRVELVINSNRNNRNFTVVCLDRSLKKFSKVVVSESCLFSQDFAKRMTKFLYDAYKKDGIEYEMALCLSKFKKEFILETNDALHTLGIEITMEDNSSGGKDIIMLFYLTDMQFKLFDAMDKLKAERYVEKKMPNVPAAKPKWYKIWWVNAIILAVIASFIYLTMADVYKHVTPEVKISIKNG